MMSDQMREEFEASAVGSRVFVFIDKENSYIHKGVGRSRDYAEEGQFNYFWFMWQAAWQASRAALVVELPEDWDPVSEKDEGAREMRDACVDAIQSAGVSVK
jgi:hypothetical protein